MPGRLTLPTRCAPVEAPSWPASVVEEADDERIAALELAQIRQRNDEYRKLTARMGVLALTQRDMPGGHAAKDLAEEG